MVETWKSYLEGNQWGGGRSFVTLVHIGIVKTRPCYSSIYCRIMMGPRKNSMIPVFHGMLFESFDD